MFIFSLFSFCGLMVFFCVVLEFLFFFTFVTHCSFLICGYSGFQVCWTLSTLYYKSYQFKYILKDLHFLFPSPYTLWFWCPFMHLHFCLFTVNWVIISYAFFFTFLMYTLIYISDPQSFYIFAFSVVFFSFPVDFLFSSI